MCNVDIHPPGRLPSAGCGFCELRVMSGTIILEAGERGTTLTDVNIFGEFRNFQKEKNSQSFC